MKSWLTPFLVLALAGAAFLLFPYNLAFLTRILIMILLVLSLDLVLGFAGIATLGQAAMYGTGAYAAGLFAVHASGNPLAGLLVGAFAGAALALVSGLLLMRTRGLTLIMLTIAVASLCLEAANQLRGLTGGADGLRGIRMQPVLGLFPFDFAGQTGYWYALSVTVLVFAGLAVLTRSAFGLSLRGIHESPARMAAIGVSVYWRQVAAYTIGGGIAGIAGALAAQITQLVSLESYSFTISAEALIMLILGGAGRLYGAVIGTVIFMVVHHVAAANDPFNWLFVIGALVLFVVFLVPNGLVSLPLAVTRLWKGARHARA
ncbi:branched-chain amino acid ABC transporter permease [Paracoccus aestuariivivens]|uniref:Branched-chain amino acid ABC transporter permease n=1 Tax=Paracoccus aestuariivivens TaxID=1820333 RepID=A0A6L6JG91_9RHOB|nr:branched-chain amino acid ABC transporter permease [Paracoccus aestuariivivens]MTH79607.1 branched-chain amino acid ABC transporter permease [Paracoccus aestuariivivens]